MKTKKNLMLLSVLAAGALSAGCVCSKNAEDPSPVIRLGTYNIRCPMDKKENTWTSRSPLLVRVIRKNDPDLFGVQEAEKNQVEDILKANPGYFYTGGGRYDFKDSGEHSCIFYKSVRFQLLDTGTFTLSEQPDVPGSLSWNTKSTRIATWGKFLDKRTGKKFYYYNTHLDFDLAGVNGAKLIVEHIRKNGQGLPLMFSGDFNAPRNSEVYQVVSAILKDSCTVSREKHEGPDYTFQGFGKYRSASPIDYIFVSDGIQVLRHVTDDEKPDGRYASDHFPVFIDLILP